MCEMTRLNWADSLIGGHLNVKLCEKMKENVIVFGRGAYWQNKKDSVVKKFNVVAFLDNNVTEGELEEEIPVYNPQNMPAILYEKIIGYKYLSF